MATQVSFNGYSLQREEIIVTEIKGDLSSPSRDLNMFQRSGEDRAILTSEYYKPKTIELTGYIHTTTTSGLDGLINEFEQKLSGQEKSLIITRDNVGARVFTTTASEINIDQPGALSTHASFTVSFNCSNPLGSQSTTVSGSFTQSNAFTSTEITISGTYPAKPLIRVDLLSGSYGQFILDSTTISGGIMVTQTATAGSALIIDCNNYEVTYNGTEIDYSGIFPEFQVAGDGVNNVVTMFSGASYSALITVDYTPKFL